MGSVWGARLQHRHAALYDKFQIGGIVPAQLTLTSRGKNAPRLHYNPPIRQSQCFQHLQTPSLPIQSLFHRTVMGLITPLLCEAADSRTAVRWVRERRRTLTQGTGADMECLSTHTQSTQGLTALREVQRQNSATDSPPTAQGTCRSPCKLHACGDDVILGGGDADASLDEYSLNQSINQSVTFYLKAPFHTGQFSSKCFTDD